MEDLIQRARHGDSKAFVELFEGGKQGMWRAAMAVLGNSDDAADALQETAVKAWRAMPRFGGRSSVDTWLMRILLRTCFDIRRKQSREMPFAMSIASDKANEDTPFLDIGCDEAQELIGRERAIDHEETMDVRHAIGQLPDGDRLILTLFYVNDCPTRHIAAILNISEGAVRTRLVRARERFKAIYCDDGRQDEPEQESEVAR